MTACLWCGRPSDGAAACLRCAPEQGHSRDPDVDELYEPTDAQALAIDRLRAELDASGLPGPELPPDEPEWFDLNEERFLLEIHPAR
ncbi:MAG TPA: hypothetical protein VNM39_13185 [Verrucomicrobiae bacterium]|nr:hypothetical protein [Verrucomicrobiae bacterium]